MLFWTLNLIRVNAFFLLLLSWSPAISIASFADWYAAHNPLHIDIAPAPSPDLGPPLSKDASRDKSLLPAQIAAIVGAYCFFVCLVGLGILIIAKTTRKRFFGAITRAKDIELAEAQFYRAYGGYTGEGQIILDHRTSEFQRYDSAKDVPNYSYPSPTRQSFKSEVYISDPTLTKIHTTGYSLGGQSVTSISPIDDDPVVRADREKMDRNLEDIYAHVMAQEDAKEHGVDIKTLPKVAPGDTPISPISSPRWSSQAKPDEPLLPPAKGKKKPQQLQLDHEKHKNVRPASKTATIMQALKSPFTALKTPKTAFPKENITVETEPLSPRHYISGPLLPANGSTHNRMTSNPSIAEQLSSTKTSPDDVYPPNEFPSAHASVQSLRVSLRERENASLRQTGLTKQPSDASARRHHLRLTPPMSPTTTMTSNQSSVPLPGAPTLHSMPTPTASPIHQTAAGTQHTASNPSGALPLRAYDTAGNDGSSNSPYSSDITNTTKTTILERTEALSPGPRTGGLKTPWTAGAVPYSPYMPNTPVVPITPRLVTRGDRRAMKKGLPRTPVQEMVGSEEEVWDSGY